MKNERTDIMFGFMRNFFRTLTLLLLTNLWITTADIGASNTYGSGLSLVTKPPSEVIQLVGTDIVWEWDFTDHNNVTYYQLYMKTKLMANNVQEQVVLNKTLLTSVHNLQELELDNNLHFGSRVSLWYRYGLFGCIIEDINIEDMGLYHLYLQSEYEQVEHLINLTIYQDLIFDEVPEAAPTIEQSKDHSLSFKPKGGLNEPTIKNIAVTFHPGSSKPKEELEILTDKDTGHFLSKYRPDSFMSTIKYIGDAEYQDITFILLAVGEENCGRYMFNMYYQEVEGSYQYNVDVALAGNKSNLAIGREETNKVDPQLLFIVLCSVGSFVLVLALGVTIWSLLTKYGPVLYRHVRNTADRGDRQGLTEDDANV